MANKKTTKNRAKKTGIKKEIEFIDGKVDDDKQALSKDIEEILMPSKNPFGTNSSEDLENKLEGMNLRQMQELAVKASVFPSGNKTTLRKKIKKEFSVKFGTKDGSRKYNAPTESPIVADKEVAKDVMAILNKR
ncbi:MAG: hypothetical protein P8P37_02345 [Candidatus Marinimicrobia bacterium]|nr:hypothetical protein [Candidatus Neomarinimicrobiota bacterium]